MKRTLQIDVVGPAEDHEIQGVKLMRCKLFVDGRTITFWTSKSNYDALVYDKVFVRDGKEKDSANMINTTNTFIEKSNP